NQPLVAFNTDSHDGPLGKTFSLLHISDDNVRVSAVKKAEDSDEVIVRLRELTGRPAKGIRIALARPIASAREVDGQEREIGPAHVQAGEMTVEMGGFELRAYALKLGDASTRLSKPRVATIDLPFDVDVVSTNAKRADGAMDAKGQSYPAEQFPKTLA